MKFSKCIKSFAFAGALLLGLSSVMPVSAHVGGALANEITTVAASGDEFVVSDYETFLSSLKTLEGYAKTYASEHVGEDVNELIFNYIRTGVERYQSGSWIIYAGQENKAFTAYVEAQDKKNGTEVRGLKNLKEFKMPNGETLEFGHMFGTLNIACYSDFNLNNSDLGGWGGDLADLMEFTSKRVAKDTVDNMAKVILEHYLLLDDEVESGFGLKDVCGDLDAFYIMNSISGSKSVSTVVENYFTKHLSMATRAKFFLETRFPGTSTRQTVRDAVFNAYSNNGVLKVLEASKELGEIDDLRKACCYAFADYLYNLTGDLSKVENKYYSEFNTVSSTLAPGITQEIKKAMSADDKQLVYYIATADVLRDDVSFHANYKDNDPSKGWGMSRVEDQMLAAIENHTNPEDPRYIPNYTPVVGTNGDFFNMTTGQPSGALVMEGVKYHNADGNNFFAILKDGTPVCGSGKDWTKYEKDVVEALGASVWLVKDGVLQVTSSSSYYNTRAPRTCVGITADNKVVVMVLDGRQGVSAGGAIQEIAQIMYDAGCVNALNLDGGGSTTYVAKEEGSDKLAVINNPSDGYQRSVSSSLMIVSTAKASTEFDHARVTAPYDYMTAGTDVKIEVSGVSVSGGPADLPAGTYAKSSDESIAVLKDGVLTAKAEGEVDVLVMAGEKIVGKKSFQVVVPDTLTFESEYVNAIYGVPVEIPVVATFNGNPVAINESEVVFSLDIPAAGTISGMTFTGKESSGIRHVVVTAKLTSDETAVASTKIVLYREDEATFDFDNATKGDEKFAFLRVIENANTNDDMIYYVDDLEKDIVGSYTFALDMKEIDIPENLKELTVLLPNGDQEGIRAWDFLLSLAERISILSYVEVSCTVDPNFDVDYSDLKVVNEYFTLDPTKTVFDKETNTLKIRCYWVDQDTAIDPAGANSLCILSGLKFTPKEGTPDVLEPSMTGAVNYELYLRANALYSFAQDKANQEKYGIYPFSRPYTDDEGDKVENGGYICKEFMTFTDSFILNKGGKNGWFKEEGDALRYYVDNKPVTGIQKVPGYLEEGKEYFYDFGDDGISKGKMNGLFELDGNLYYAVLGEMKTGWRTIAEDEKNSVYYFDVQTGKAVNGDVTIDGYKYGFKDYKLVRGQFVKNENGVRYMWAGDWATQEWIRLDGELYYAHQNGYLLTGITRCYDINGDWKYVVFDENGRVEQDVYGLYEYEGNTYYVQGGYMIERAGLVKVGKDYYYFNSSNIAVKNQRYYISVTNGLLKEGNYNFDKEGKIVFDENQKDPNPGYTPEGTVLRIYGDHRFATSLLIAQTYKDTLGVDKLDSVIIASGMNFPDALAGSYLAAAKNAPILMTDGKTYNKGVFDFIEDNVKSGATVYILGGEAAVPAAVEAGLEGYNVVRLAGAHRFETNLMILEEAGVKDQPILVCTGLGFADSLSASATGYPILLVGSSLTAEQKAFLAEHTGNKLYIIGGTSAVNAKVESEVKTYGSVKRIGGASRFDTSVMIADAFFDGADDAVLAYAANFPDGLCGGPLAAAMDAPLVLTMNKGTGAAEKYMEKEGIHTGTILGGTKLIDDKSIRTIFDLSANVPIVVIK